jgi:hypothetical protein
MGRKPEANWGATIISSTCMMQHPATDHIAELAFWMMIFTPLIVLSVRAAVDPAPAIALINRISSELESFNPPWMQRSRRVDPLPDTAASRAMVRLLFATLTAAAFYQLATQLTRMVH